MTRHLVLGAGGFLGGAVARRLRSTGAEVVGFGRPPRTAASPAAFPFVSARIEDEAALRSALEGIDVVHHLLGAPTPAAVEAEFDRTEDVTLQRLLDLARERGVRRLVFASSGGPLYGRDAPVPTSEAAEPRPHTPYGRAKLSVERRLLEARSEAFATVSMRISNVFGPGQAPDRGQGLVATAVRRALTGAPIEVWGDGQARRDYVHVDDVAGAFVLAAAYPGPEPALNIASGVGRSVLEVVADAAAALDRPAPPVVHRPARGADVAVSTLDPALAARELGWRAGADWREALRATAAWQQAAGFG